MEKLIEFQNITKKYGNRLIIENTSFTINKKEVVALVGKNGSGKTTLLKIIAGLKTPTNGTLLKNSDALKVGYVPEFTPAFIPFTPAEYLFHMGNIRGMEKELLLKRIDYLLALFDLEDARNIRFAHFSKGMKQKVMLMQAMLEEVDLLILDEPLSGLDQKAQIDLETTLLRLKTNQFSVVLSCHETKLLERLADRVMVINNRQVVETDFLKKDEVEENLLAFEIGNRDLYKDIYSLFKNIKEFIDDAGVCHVKGTIDKKHTEEILLKLLQRKACIKQLQPIDSEKEKLYHILRSSRR